MIACKRIFYGGALHVRGAVFDADDADLKQLLKSGSARVPAAADMPAPAARPEPTPRGRYRRRDLTAEE
jgi:hypothetical protein